MLKLSRNFVKSKAVIRVISLSKSYGVLPSDIMGIDDCYTAFCFNEACLYIMNEFSAKNGKNPVFANEKETGGLIDFLKESDKHGYKRGNCRGVFDA